MENIAIIKHSSLHKLKGKIEDNLPHYERGEIHKHVHPSVYGTRETHVPFSKAEDGMLLRNPTDDDVHEVENCLLVSKWYNQLTPQQAGDKRVWVYATHFTFCDYVHNRWPVPQQPNPGESAQKFHERKIRHVQTHYFAESNRNIIRDNAISRLWWMGYIAKRSSQYGQRRTLEILLKQSDVRANILERPTLSMSAEVFDQIIYHLGSDLEKLEKEGKRAEKETLFDRDNFRRFIKNLNRVGGMKALNALSIGSLKNLMESIKGDVIPQAK